MLLLRPFATLMIVSLVGGGSALAQSAPTPAPTAASVSAPAPAPALTVDTPIETLVAAPQAKAVLDADIPGLTDHPMYAQFKRESLRALAPKFGGAITDQDLAKVQADLTMLPPAASASR